MVTFLVDCAVLAGAPEPVAGLLLSLGAAMVITGRRGVRRDRDAPDEALAAQR